MQPLASKIRPKSLVDFIGQDHLVSEGKPIFEAIKTKHLFSFILWGPPGVGKTTLSRIYSQALGAEYHELSAVKAGKDEIRKFIELPSFLGKAKILFLDEIHRFNKAQQDFLLPYVESGELTLVGATTENPSFEIIPALLSRVRVFTLFSLSEEALLKILDSVGLSIGVSEKEFLVSYSGGDARKMLSLVEHTNRLFGEISLENLQNGLQNKFLRYDKSGDEHYNTISAFIKSMRASQVDAALYYLARMVESGEDPLFIARRMVIFASEDIGMAVPTALVVANAVFRACETVGYPECAINLAHGAVYLSECKKDKSSYSAYKQAASDSVKYGNLAIPLNILNATTNLMQDLGYGQGYEPYSDESFLPDELKSRKYYHKQKP